MERKSLMEFGWVKRWASDRQMRQAVVSEAHNGPFWFEWLLVEFMDEDRTPCKESS